MTRAVVNGQHGVGDRKINRPVRRGSLLGGALHRCSKKPPNDWSDGVSNRPGSARMTSMKRTSIKQTLALLAVAAIALTGCTDAAGAGRPLNSQEPNASAGITPTASAGTVGPALVGPTATSMLNMLTVKGKAPATGYDRNGKFGNGWKDPDGNKCDARQDILARDLTQLKFKDAKRCTVASGKLGDLYTGKTLNWKVNSGSVDIDHAIALKNAWVSGAQQLSLDQRVALSNDPLNLIASDASANRSKGDKNTAEWLPPNKGFRCQYVATQISVKAKYALAVTAPEKAAMAKVLKTCPTQKAAKITPIKLGAKAAPAPKATPTKPPAIQVNPGTYCSEAGAKGAGEQNGKTYTCKTSNVDTRLRWRA